MGTALLVMDGRGLTVPNNRPDAVLASGMIIQHVRKWLR